MIEAQIAGLPAIISDTITKDVEVTEGLVYMESIQKEPSYWAEKAIALLEQSKGKERLCQRRSIQDAGYDIDMLVKWYEKYFDEMCG